MTTIGTVEYGNTSYPIIDIYYTNSDNENHIALITGGVHGNEIAGVQAILEYLDYLNTKIDNSYKDHVFKVNNGVLKFPSILIYYQNCFSQSPLAHYFYIHHDKCAFTFESSMYEKLELRVIAHKSVIRYFLEM
jgi:hypothetical protein